MASPTILNESADAKHDPYAAFRSRNYRLFLSGFSFGTIGFQMQNVAVAWEIYKWTGSSLSLGWIGLALAIPVIVLALPAGHMADQYDRRKLTIISLFFTSLFAAMMGVVSLGANHGTITFRTAELSMYLLLLLSSAVASFGRPARAALLPQIVQPHVFANAVTWNSSIFELSSMAGPALGGMIISWSSSSAYFINAILCIVYLVFLSILTIERQPERAKRAAGMRDLVVGVEFVWKKKLLLGAMTLDLFAVLLGGAVFLLPVFAKDILFVGEMGFGWLRAAPSLGAFTMAFLIAHLPPMKHAGRAMLIAVAGFGAVTIVFGLSRSFTLSMCMLFLTGAFDSVSVVVRHTLIQLLTPDSMRGRVSAVNQVFIGSSNELGGLESGLTSHFFSPVISVVGGGIGTILVVIAAAMRWPEIGQVGALNEIKPATIEATLPPAAFEPMLTEEESKDATV